MASQLLAFGTGLYVLALEDRYLNYKRDSPRGEGRSEFQEKALKRSEMSTYRRSSSLRDERSVR